MQGQKRKQPSVTVEGQPSVTVEGVNVEGVNVDGKNPELGLNLSREECIDIVQKSLEVVAEQAKLCTSDTLSDDAVILSFSAAQNALLSKKLKDDVLTERNILAGQIDEMESSTAQAQQQESKLRSNLEIVNKELQKEKEKNATLGKQLRKALKALKKNSEGWNALLDKRPLTVADISSSDDDES